MRQISRRVEMIHPTIVWRPNEHGTHKHAHGSGILWSVSRVRSKTIHSLSCITSWLPYITLCYIDSRFFLPLEQSRTALLGCHLAASRLRETARWQLTNRCHVAMRPLSNRSQMTSKCEWLKQKSGTQAAGECVTDIFTLIYVSVLQVTIFT